MDDAVRGEQAGSGVVEPIEERDRVELAKEEEQALKDLDARVSESERSERLEEVRTCREAREAWNCRLHLAYDDETGRFYDSVKVVLEENEDLDEDDLPSHETDPFYLAYGLDATSILGTVPFKTKFWPGDPDKPKDQTASRRAMDLVAWFRKQNDDVRLRFAQGYFDYTDGGFALFTRYRPDARKYGVRQEEVLSAEEVELFPASAHCPYCGMAATEEQAGVGQPYGGPCPTCGGPDANGACMDCGEMVEGTCPGCGKGLPSSAWRQAVTGEVPVSRGTVEVPNAGPVYEVYGWLECRRPVNADRIEDCQWIDLSLEVHRALALAAFPDKETEIRASTEPGEGTHREERAARESTSASNTGATEREHHVTYRRRWLRPEMLWEVEDKDIRKRLLKRFKKGVLLVFVNDVLVRQVEEDLLDYWQIAPAYPGLGHSRPAIGTPVLNLQRPHNTLFNLRIDHLKAAVPSMLADPRVVNVDAMNKRRMKPLAWYAAEPLHGDGDLRNAMAPTPTPALSADLFRLQDLLPGQRAQHASGIPAVAWGGQMGGAGETYAGYALMREQGLSRMRIPLGAMKAANERADLQAVRLFQRYHQDDVMIPKEGPAGSVAKDRVTIDELEGEIQIRSETDLPIPATQAEKIDRFFRAVKEDGLRDLLLHEGNEGFLRTSLGDESIRLPGQAQRDQQRLEIDRLLNGEEVEVNPLLDDHPAHIGGILQWWASPDAETERSSGNPNVERVVAHYVAHEQAQAQRAFLLAALGGAPPQMGAPGMPAQGGPPQGGPPQGAPPQMAGGPA